MFKKESMKTIIALLFTAIVIQGCSNTTDSSSSTTELEGSWESTCSSNFLPLNGNTLNTIPFKTKFTYTTNNVSMKINVYSDHDCTTLSSTLLAENSNLIALNTIPKTFEIGDIIQTRNGVTVKKLNNYNISGELLPDIYLLQNNNSTLYFGKLCINPIDNFVEVCTNDRPTQINYDNYYTKQDL